MSLGRSGPPLFAVCVFWAFVLGGLAFGMVFVSNWRAIATRVNAAHETGAPSAVVTLGAGPMTLSVPVNVNPPAALPAPAKPAQIAGNIASAVVKTVLPDWQGTDPVNI